MLKQRYTITIADIEMNVISEESPENVESYVGMVDRKMREILTASRRCSKNEAALLCALDYCSEKTKAQRKIRLTENEVGEKAVKLAEQEREIEKLKKKVEKLENELLTARESLRAAKETAALASLSAIETETAAPEAAAPEAAAPEAAPVSAEPKEEPASAAPEEIAPEDIAFDPTEIFRRVKKSRESKAKKKS